MRICKTFYFQNVTTNTSLYVLNKKWKKTGLIHNSSTLVSIRIYLRFIVFILRFFLFLIYFRNREIITKKKKKS